MSDPKRIVLYGDGSCISNPGPGGWAVVLRYGTHRKELCGGRRLTTNNRMELLAVIEGLLALKTEHRCVVTVRSDSRYVVDGVMKGWARSWRAAGWIRRGGEQVVNFDLWALLLDLCDRHEVLFEWVRGHAGDADNEFCDRLALQAAQAVDLPPDDAFEQRDERQSVTGGQPTLFEWAEG
jgi:ribonuclease HI